MAYPQPPHQFIGCRGKALEGSWRRVKSTWRSWFWNTVACLCFVVMAVLVTAVAINQTHFTGRAIVAAGFGAVGILLWVAAVRSMAIGVTANAEGIVVRSLWRTARVPWNDVESVEGAKPRSGAASVANLAVPVVRWKPQGSLSIRTTELNMLGGYRSSRSGPTLSERAVEDLNEYLSRWRVRNSTER